MQNVDSIHFVQNVTDLEFDEMASKTIAGNGFGITCAEAAKIIGICNVTLSRQARLGMVPSRRRGIGRNAKYFFHKNDVERLRKIYQEGVEVTATA